MMKRHGPDIEAPSPPVVLAIGGFDPTGGAGVLVDGYAIRAAGAHPAAVVAVTTIQDGNRFIAATPHDAGAVRVAAALMLERFPVGAVKTGALGSDAVVSTLSELARSSGFPPLIVDPVMMSSSCGRLLDEAAVSTMGEALIPAAALVTPNLAEAEALTGVTVTGLEGMGRAAEEIVARGARAVLVKGGHLPGGKVTDLLLDQGGNRKLFHHRRIGDRDVRGTGCALAALVAAFVAQGRDLLDAVERSQAMLQRAIHSAVRIGDGPLHLGGLSETTTSGMEASREKRGLNR